MKAIAARTPGKLSALELVELPAPSPAAGQVRVRVQASSANPADLKTVCWKDGARFIHAKAKPLVPGYDVSGVVDQLGSGVKDLSEGDAVFGHLAYSRKTRQGSFGQYVVMEADHLAIKPEAVEHLTAAAAATCGLTALQALRDRARLTEGARLLVIGASGGVGSLTVPVGKRLGAHVTGVCSTYAVDFVRQLGADAIVDRKNADPLAHDEPFDVIFDTTAKYSYGACTAILKPGGTFVTTLPSLSFVLGKLRTALSSRRCSLVVVQSVRRDLVRLGEWIAGGLPVPVAEIFPVKDATAALERLEAGGVLGKIAIDVASGF